MAFRPPGLNPFYFRAAFGRKNTKNIVYKNRSQSLLLQGCFRTASDDGRPGAGRVSIPFTSGLLSDPIEATIHMRGSVSIPFTSGLLSDGAPVAGRSRGYVSIPFTSGLLSDLAFAAACVVPAGLNPFYFRAAFGLARPRNRVGAARSQSLLLQGCFRTRRPCCFWGGRDGLNPFYFRAAFGQDQVVEQISSNSLNPFYFRAAFGLIVS